MNIFILEFWEHNQETMDSKWSSYILGVFLSFDAAHNHAASHLRQQQKSSTYKFGYNFGYHVYDFDLTKSNTKQQNFHNLNSDVFLKFIESDWQWYIFLWYFC